MKNPKKIKVQLPSSKGVWQYNCNKKIWRIPERIRLRNCFQDSQNKMSVHIIIFKNLNKSFRNYLKSDYLE